MRDVGEQVAYASWGRRAVAALVDAFILFWVFYAVGAPIALATPDTERFDPVEGEYVSTDKGDGLLLLWIAVFWFVVVPMYFALFHGRTKGATPGKRTCGIGVRLDDDPFPRPNVGHAFGRQFVSQLLWLTVVLGVVDFLWPLFDNRRRTLHDKVCDTIVVKTHAARAAPSYAHTATCWRCGALNVLAPGNHRFLCYACGRDNVTSTDSTSTNGPVVTRSPQAYTPMFLIFVGAANVLLGVFKYNFHPASLVPGGLFLTAGLVWLYVQNRGAKTSRRRANG